MLRYEATVITTNRRFIKHGVSNQRMKKNLLLVMAFLLLIFVVAGCSKGQKGQVIIDKGTVSPGITTFIATQDAPCTDQQGRPVIRLFSTSWCPHCQWIKSTYTKVVNEYAAQGKITAYLWETDLDDDLLTEEKDSIPSSEQAVYKKYNPEESIPTFIFGCKYMRIGNGYELQKDLAAEEAEFRAVIDKLLEEAKP